MKKVLSVLVMSAVLVVVLITAMVMTGAIPAIHLLPGELKVTEEVQSESVLTKVEVIPEVEKRQIVRHWEDDIVIYVDKKSFNLLMQLSFNLPITLEEKEHIVINIPKEDAAALYRFMVAKIEDAWFNGYFVSTDPIDDLYRSIFYVTPPEESVLEDILQNPEVEIEVFESIEFLNTVIESDEGLDVVNEIQTNIEEGSEETEDIRRLQEMLEDLDKIESEILRG